MTVVCTKINLGWKGLTYPEPLGPLRPVAGHLYFLLLHLVCDDIFSISLLLYFQKYLEAAVRLRDTQDTDDKGPSLLTKCRMFRPASLSFSSLFTDEDKVQNLT